MSEHKYRVRIVVYDDVETTPDNPAVVTDEPLGNGIVAADEMSMQAYRTHRLLLPYIRAREEERERDLIDLQEEGATRV